MAKIIRDEGRRTNLWDVLIRAMDLVYNLLSLERISAALMFTFVVCLLITVAKYPSNDLPIIARNIVNIFHNVFKNNVYAYIITAVAIISIAGNVVTYRVLSKEVRRLAAKRKQLVHGRRKKELITIDKHNSSNLAK